MYKVERLKDLYRISLDVGEVEFDLANGTVHGAELLPGQGCLLGQCLLSVLDPDPEWDPWDDADPVTGELLKPAEAWALRREVVDRAISLGTDGDMINRLMTQTLEDCIKMVRRPYWGIALKIIKGEITPRCFDILPLCKAYLAFSKIMPVNEVESDLDTWAMLADSWNQYDSNGLPAWHEEPRLIATLKRELAKANSELAKLRLVAAYAKELGVKDEYILNPRLSLDGVNGAIDNYYNCTRLVAQHPQLEIGDWRDLGASYERLQQEAKAIEDKGARLAFARRQREFPLAWPNEKWDMQVPTSYEELVQISTEFNNCAAHFEWDHFLSNGRRYLVTATRKTDGYRVCLDIDVQSLDIVQCLTLNNERVDEDTRWTLKRPYQKYLISLVED